MIFLFIIAGSLCRNACLAQTAAIDSAAAFVNRVFHTAVDSSFSKYYLSAQAIPCSFVRFEYDEWVKYTLRETVTMEVLNELAEKSYNNRKPSSWQQEQLTGAVCISGKKTDSILDPAFDLRQNGSPVEGAAGKGAGKEEQKDILRRQKAEAHLTKAIHRRFEKWARLPPEQRTVFFFSKPLFTDDGRYAIIDMDYRCDAQQCGVSSTCLFRRIAGGWMLIGKKVK